MYVHFEIIASLGNQPERRSMNYLMLGNSTFFQDLDILQTWKKFFGIYYHAIFVTIK